MTSQLVLDNDSHEFEFIAKIWSDNFRKYATNVNGMQVCLKIEPFSFDTDFLDKIDNRERNLFNCNTCRKNFTLMSSLVTVIGGKVTSFFPETIDGKFKNFLEHINMEVSKRVPIGFWAPESSKGIPATPYVHDGVTSLHFSTSGVFSPGLNQNLSIYQQDREAGLRSMEQAVEQLNYAMKKFSQEIVLKGIAACEDKNEIYILETFSSIYQMTHLERMMLIPTLPNSVRHINSGISELILSETMKETPVDEIKDKVRKAKNPITYMRPTTTSAQNEKKTESELEKRGVNLQTRFASISDIPEKFRIWSSNDNKETHIHTRNENIEEITWHKFTKMWLPKVERMEIKTGNNSPYHMTVSAVETNLYYHWNNTLSVYTRPNNTFERWGVSSNVWTKVKNIMHLPWMFSDYKGEDNGIFIDIEGCRDPNSDGMAIFPCDMKPEFHPFRSTIEKISNEGRTLEATGPRIGGFCLRDNKNWKCVTIRITLNTGIVQTFKITSYE